MADAPAQHLAQLNIGRLLADTDDPRVAGFMDNIERVNAAGKRMPGFVWMMEGSGGPGNTDAKIGGDPRFIANLTVWESVSALKAFVWGRVHKQFYDQKADWFEVMDQAHFVMWWIPAGHRPSLDEGLARLAHLQEHGGGAQAFGWADIAEAEGWRAEAS